mgnify:CR=1 FL=1
MLRVEQDDPFSDIFYYGPNITVSTIEETSTIVVSIPCIMSVKSHSVAIEWAVLKTSFFVFLFDGSTI